VCVCFLPGNVWRHAHSSCGTMALGHNYAMASPMAGGGNIFPISGGGAQQFMSAEGFPAQSFGMGASNQSYRDSYHSHVTSQRAQSQGIGASNHSYHDSYQAHQTGQRAQSHDSYHAHHASQRPLTRSMSLEPPHLPPGMPAGVSVGGNPPMQLLTAPSLEGSMSQENGGAILQQSARPCARFEEALSARLSILKSDLAADFSKQLTSCLSEEEVSGSGTAELLRQEVEHLRCENMRLQQQLQESGLGNSAQARLRPPRGGNRVSIGGTEMQNRQHIACDPTTKKQIEDAKKRRDARVIQPGANEEMHSSWTGMLAGYIDRVNAMPDPTSVIPVMRALMRLVKSNFFDTSCTTVIVINSFVMGLSSEYAILNPATPETPFIVNVNRGFAAFYFLEIMVRIYTFQLLFFFNADWRWNMFDFLLVAASVYSTISALTSGGGGGGGGGNVLRLLRLLKLMKMMRMIRLMSSFKELRMMLFPIIKSMRSLFWTLFMLTIILYVFGITMLQAAAGAVVDFSEGRKPDVEPAQIDDLIDLYGTIPASMETLYMAVTGGNDWGNLAAPIKLTGPVYYPIFLFYISFLTFAVLNILTGIFVDTAMSYSQEDADNISILQMDDTSYLDKLADVLCALDVDDSGALSYVEFEVSLESPSVREFLQDYDINPVEAKMLFWRLSEHGTHEVSIPDFIHIFTRMKGPAKQSDLQALTFDLKRLSMAMHEISSHLDARD